MDRYRFRFTTVTAVVVANMVGTGVFTSLGFQLLVGTFIVSAGPAGNR